MGVGEGGDCVARGSQTYKAHVNTAVRFVDALLDWKAGSAIGGMNLWAVADMVLPATRTDPRERNKKHGRGGGVQPPGLGQ